MFSSNNGLMSVDDYGAGELIDYCSRINEAETQKICMAVPISKNNMNKLVYTLYIEVIQKYMVSSMPSPPIEVPIDCLDGYYNLSKEKSERLCVAINNLRKATHYNNGEVDMENVNWGAITSSLRESEYSKVEIFVREAYRILSDNPCRRFM